MKRTFMAGVLGALVLAPVLAQADAGTRGIPRPLPSHPGNMFLVGETVTVLCPPTAEGDTLRAVDYDGRIVAEGRVKTGTIELGRLPVGYYEVWRPAAGATNCLSICVLGGFSG